MKQLTKEKTNCLLSMYVGYGDAKETLRHYMPVEFDDKKWCAATDASQFIMVLENNENILPPPVQTVDIVRIIPALELNIKIHIGLLKAEFDQIPMVDVDITKQCDACDGEGWFDHYGERYDCKTCDEIGTVKTGKTKNVKNPNVRFQFNERFVFLDHVKKMLDVVEIVGAKKVSIKANTGIPIIFQLDDEILIGMGSKSREGVEEDEDFKDLEFIKFV